MKFPVRYAIPAQGVHQFYHAATGIVVGNTPQGALRRVGDDARRLGVDQFVVISQSCGLVGILEFRLEHLLDHLPHDAVVSGYDGVLEPHVYVPFLIQPALEEMPRPGLDFGVGICSQHEGVAAVEPPPV